MASWKKIAVGSLILGAGVGGLVLAPDRDPAERTRPIDRDASRAERLEYLRPTASTEPSALAKRCWEAGGLLYPGEKFPRTGEERVTFRSVRCVFEDAAEIEFEKPMRKDEQYRIKNDETVR